MALEILLIKVCMNIPQIHITNTNPMDHVNEDPDSYLKLETRLEIIVANPKKILTTLSTEIISSTNMIWL